MFHCFCRGAGEAREAVAMGHFLSFAGTLTFGDETGRMLAEVARFVPGERIMVSNLHAWTSARLGVLGGGTSLPS